MTTNTPLTTPLHDTVEDMRARFAVDGFVHIPAVLTPAQVAELAGRTPALFGSEHQRSRQVLYVSGEAPPETPHLDAIMHTWLNPHRFTDGLGTGDLLSAPRAAAAKILNTDPVLLQDIYLIKEPGQQRFAWHQDFPFWPIDKPLALTCWIPLFDSAEGAGNLQLAPRSHQIGVHGAIDLHREIPQAAGEERVDVEAQFSVVEPAFAAGDALLFSPLLYHCSGPRTLPGRRPAWASTWLHPRVRWSHARAPTHPLCPHIEDGAFVSELD